MAVAKAAHLASEDMTLSAPHLCRLDHGETGPAQAMWQEQGKLSRPTGGVGQADRSPG